MATDVAPICGTVVGILWDGKLLVCAPTFSRPFVCAKEEEANNADRRACRGLIMSFGTFFRYYDEQILPEATDTAIGLIGGVQAFIVLLLSFIVGRLLDAKFHQIIVAVGGILTWLGYFCLGFSLQGPENQGRYGVIILTQSIIAGVGMSCFFTHSSHCAIQVRKEPAQGNIPEADIFVEWFPRHKYFAVGITSAGAAVGMMRNTLDYLFSLTV